MEYDEYIEKEMIEQRKKGKKIENTSRYVYADMRKWKISYFIMHVFFLLVVLLFCIKWVIENVV